LNHLIKAELLISGKIPDVRFVLAGKIENFQKYEDLMVNRNNFLVYNRFISIKRSGTILKVQFGSVNLC